MSWKRRLQGGVMGLIGFLLSPLSWWNDLFVNVPLAVGAGWLVGWFWPAAFEPAVVVAYWATNVLGLVLLHRGAQQALSPSESRPYGRRELLRDLSVSCLYTLLIVALLKFKVLRPFSAYLDRS